MTSYVLPGGGVYVENINQASIVPGAGVFPDGTSSGYSAGVSETIVLTEVLSSTGAFGRSLSESSAVVDSVSTSAFLTASVEESAVTLDAINNSFAYDASIAELGVLAEDWLSTTASQGGSADRIVYALSEFRIVYSVDWG